MNDPEILSSEQVNILDREIKKHGKPTVMMIHSMGNNGWEKDCECLNGISVYKMAKALFNGYTVKS